MREKFPSVFAPTMLRRCFTGLTFVTMMACCCTLVEAGERWSRQLTEFTGGLTGGNDWIPLSRPGSERHTGGRVLNYFTAPQQSFLGPDNTAQPQQQHFTFLNHQFPQSNRFVLQQPLQHHQDEILEQNQPFHLNSFQRTPPFVTQTIQHPPPSPPSPSSSTHGFEQQFLVKSPLSQALIQQDNKQQQTLLNDQQQFSYQHIRQPETEQVHVDHTQSHAQPVAPSAGSVSHEEVQLLYVPVETLYKQKQSSPVAENNRFNSLPQPVSPSLINDFYTSAATTTTPKPSRISAATSTLPSSHFSASSFEAVPLVSRSSSSSSNEGLAKPKPNQPPLALFLNNEGRQGKLSTNDALGGLKNINEIAVLDAIGKNSPKVFIGPSGLAPPKSYSRFDLPYLSSVDLSSNRANRKIEELPFFVAPLSYKTPGGYSKIALPPPHVGSIVVRQGSSGNSVEQTARYSRPTAQSNVQYYTPSTLNFADSTTIMPPITSGTSGKPVYDADHYTSPTGSTSLIDQSLTQYNAFNGPPPSRHAVNEEYFNLAKTRKPTTTPATTPSYSFRSYGSTKQFDFKPMPEQKIPSSYYPSEEDNPATTTTIRTTTEKPTTAQLHFEAERMRTHFREENFRSRRPYQHHEITTTSPDDAIDTKGHKHGNFVHKFKLVDSVRPTAQTKPSSASVVDDDFLNFFNHPPRQQHGDEMIKTTITTTLPGSTERQVIRNNYFSAAAAINDDSGANKHKFVSTYYTPSSTAAGTTGVATTSATLTTQDLFFREFDQKSKFYQHEPKYESTFPTTIRTTGASYINKYKYEKDSNHNEFPSYSVEVITTSEPTTATAEPTQRTTDSQYYNIPSELPPISANLPGLVNALMDDQWPQKNPNRQTPTTVSTGSDNLRGPNFRKQLHRTTTQASVMDAYHAQSVTTTKRPLQRGRRPHPSRTTSATLTGTESSEQTSKAPISRSRSRYVPNDEERSAPRGRSRSRSTTPRGPLKEVENLEYQRDVLKQNYPSVIRPQGQSIVVTTSPAATTIATTQATTLSFREAYEDQTERLISTTLGSEAPLEVTRKYSGYSSETADEAEAGVTTVLPPQTTSYFVPSSQQSQRDVHSPTREEFVRSQEVIPLPRSPEQLVVPLRPQHAMTKEPLESRTPQYQMVTESEEKLTTAYGQQVDEPARTRKVEITPRPRRPGLVSRQRDSQQTYQPRTTTERTTTTEPSGSEVGSRSSGRRPAFVRRPSRLYATTTAASAPTTIAGNDNDQPQPTQGSYITRSKNRQDILRGRTRRPTTTTEPTAAATTASPDAPVTRAFGRGSNLRRVTPTARSRHELAPTSTTQQSAPTSANNNGPRFRIRERTRFNLQPQESQWSSKLNQNSFQPVLKLQSTANDLEQDIVTTEPETEIVTASREADMYLVNVSSNYGQKDNKQEAETEDSTENSVPSFADMLNDVMKEFIDDNSQKKNIADNSGDKVVSEEPRRAVNFRKNFLRKTGRSKGIDSFETAESQHASQVYNDHRPQYGESVKNINHAVLWGKNAPHKETVKLQHKQQSKEQEEAKNENEAVENVTEYLPTVPGSVVNSSLTADSTILDVKTSTKPTEESTTLASFDQTTVNSQSYHDQATTEGSFTEAITVEPELENYSTHPSLERETQTAGKDGSFDVVKEMFSDYYKVVENDSETEEVIDDEEQAAESDDPEEEDVLRATEQRFAENEGLIEPSTKDMTPSDTLFVPVTADPPPDNPMGSLVIPTSLSNGVTHETEICSRGRCMKTDDDKRMRKKLN